jgi:hypothetical protein
LRCGLARIRCPLRERFLSRLLLQGAPILPKLSRQARRMVECVAA